ncbi:vascular cell adhesion protein 1 isoform 1-T1 [Liasis olivaceus]
MAAVTSAALSLLLFFTTAKAFEIEDIVPGHKVVAQIGDQLVLTCRTTGCESPYFSWRTQLDHPLGGKLHNQGNSSVLIIQSVEFKHEHQYVCTAGCKSGEPSKEKAVMIDIYSFPSNPVIELKSPLILGEPASVTCSVPSVYPSEQLKITLLRGQLTTEKEFFQDPHTQSLQTKNLKIDFIPTEEDFGKEIICIAELPIEEMALKPKQRQATHTMEISYGPQNTHITASPGNTIVEGEALTLICLTESHPQASFVWKKQLAEGITQNITKKHNLSIPNPQVSDSGIYICEVTNEVTSKVDRKSLYISIQASVFSPTAPTLTTPSETMTSFTSDTPSKTTTSFTSHATLKTMMSVTSEIAAPKPITSFTSHTAPKMITSVTSHAAPKMVTSVTSHAAPKMVTSGTSHAAPKIITSVTSHAAPKNNTIMFLVDVSDDDGNNTEQIIIIAKVGELDYMTPVIIVVSCLAIAAGPMAAIFIYIFRKMKINGSYSLANSLKPII